MPDVQVRLRLVDDRLKSSLDKSSESAKKLEKNLQNTPKRLDDIRAIGTKVPAVFGAVAAAAAAAGAAIGAVFTAKEAIKAASIQEEAVNSVANSLRLMGDASNEALKDVQAFASALQDSTGIGDEVTLKLFSVAQAYGANREQAKLAVQAAAELSAATGKGLEEALAQAAKTLGGFAGELGEVNPRIKALTAEQLKNGEALRVLIEQYGGSAASKLQTFGGAITALQGRFSDFLEPIGEIVTKNPVVIAAINAIEKVFRVLTNTLAENGDRIRALVNVGLKAIIDSVPTVFRAVERLVQIFLSMGRAILSIGSAIGTFDLLQNALSFTLDVASTFAQGFIVATQAVLEGLQAFAELGRRMGVIGKEVEQSLIKIRRSLDDLGSALARKGAINFFDPVNEASKDTAENLSNITKIFEDLARQVTTLPDSTSINLDVLPNVGEVSKKLADVVGSKTKPPLEISGSLKLDPISKFISEFRETISNFLARFPETTRAVINGLKVIGGNVLKGRAGAESLISGAAGMAADAVAPGAGPAVSAIVGELAKGPEHVKNMVNGFADAFPDIINNIIEAIPVLIDKLAERAPDVILAIAKGSPQMTLALVKAFSDPKIVLTIATGLVKGIGQAISEESQRIKKDLISFSVEYQKVLKHITRVIENIPSSFSGAFKNSIQNIIGEWRNLWGKALSSGFGDLFKSIEKFIDRIFPKIGGSKGKGALGLGVSVGGVKLASGGFVRGSGIRDTVPAMLTPGELVIDRTTGPMLREALQSGSFGGDAELKALLSRLIFLMSDDRQPIRIEINGRVLGEAILDLNRRNQRLAV